VVAAHVVVIFAFFFFLFFFSLSPTVHDCKTAGRPTSDVPLSDHYCMVRSFADVRGNILSLANNIPIFFQKTSCSSKLTSKTHKKKTSQFKASIAL